MFIDQYFHDPGGHVSFTREQASDFAKRVADDFNPLHDADARRFCVPGDLLLGVVLAKYGVSRHMEIVFSGMVADGIELVLPEPAAAMTLCDAEGREYLQLTRSGDVSHDESLIEQLTRSYVEFSGHTFPHILAPLLAAQGKMLNPQRPMVMYQSMEIDLDTLDVSAPTLSTDTNTIDIDGKRGAAVLSFNLKDGDRVVGRGCKRMLMSGLIEYDEAASEEGIAAYLARKETFLAV